MATYVAHNRDLFLKLNVTGMALKASIAKLYAHHLAVSEEKRKDREYYDMYLKAYSDDQDDLTYSELFTNISLEADKLMKENND
ncbi:hypothetical protein [Bacillus velezensis]|uniref:hypothetical protein n=1 Tax=Bacillus velezensis TaxID=492670 RepID=UPI000E430DCF|nr:hypothetical protein [Bacillus velezensis]AXT13441.1 hypothetical protein D0U03_13880 [Bacillus velezensis]